MRDGAKMLIAELMAGAPDEQFYDAKVTVLSEEIRHHVKEEAPSEGLFSKASATGADMGALGEQVQVRKEALKAQIEANGLPTQKTWTLKGVHVEYGQPVV